MMTIPQLLTGKTNIILSLVRNSYLRNQTKKSLTKMKKYLTKMKKYYFILIAMLTMSVNAMAQTTQKHLFPEVVFDWTKDGVTYQYVVPAWDALTAKKERVQKVIDPSSGGDGPGGDDGGGDDTGGEDGGDRRQEPERLPSENGFGRLYRKARYG